MPSFGLLGAISGFVAVGAGAFGAHALKAHLSADLLAIFETAARYQMYHALALLAVGVLARSGSSGTALNIAGLGFLIGTLIFSDPVGWQSASGRYGLLLAEILAIITAVVFVTRVVRFGQPGGRAPADVAARTYHGRYLTAADFDARSRVLLRRTQDAVDGVTSAEIYQADLLDAPATGLALAGQEWDIALALREQARLRARRAAVPADGAGPQTAAVLDHQVQAARLADASIAARVAALEGYAAEVREADAAYRDWRQAAALAEVSRQHLDMLARTAADEHGIAEIDTMTRQARAIRQAFREPPG